MAERGQASVEVVAAVPAILLVGLLCLQLLATGYAASVADGAAEAGAIACRCRAAGRRRDHAALPEWARERVRGGGPGRAADRDPAAAVAAGALGARARGELIGLGADGRTSVAELVAVSELESASGGLGVAAALACALARGRARAGRRGAWSRLVASERAARRCSPPSTPAALERSCERRDSRRPPAAASPGWRSIPTARWGETVEEVVEVAGSAQARFVVVHVAPDLAAPDARGRPRAGDGGGPRRPAAPASAGVAAGA